MGSLSCAEHLRPPRARRQPGQPSANAGALTSAEYPRQRCNTRVGPRVQTAIRMLVAAIAICWGLFVGIWIIGALYNARYAPRTVSREWRPWF